LKNIFFIFYLSLYGGASQGAGAISLQGVNAYTPWQHHVPVELLHVLPKKSWLNPKKYILMKNEKKTCRIFVSE
jgi:hypothetical protein